jgi:hypothetical protein
MLEIDSPFEILEGMEKLQELVFEPMEHEEKIIYLSLFPRITNLDKYGIEKLPPRVYELWDKSKEALEEFGTGTYYVLENRNHPDPVLVWQAGQDYSWMEHLLNNDVYYIARWGKALVSFEELKQKFIVLIKARIKTVITEKMIYYKSLEKSLDEVITLYLYRDDEKLRKEFELAEAERWR